MEKRKYQTLTLGRAVALLTAFMVLSVFVKCSSGGGNGEESDSLSVAPGAINFSYEGLKEGEGRETVVANCTACHSDKLIVQNRATREGWQNMIRWMQETQRLWDLGENEKVILDYLEANYAPEETNARRKNLENIEWYELE